MPSYRSINITLISQLGIKEVPEFNPPPVSNDPFSDYPIAIDEPRATTSVYVPTYPESQFWIQYSISPPHPPQALYYFKVVINDKSVVSWGCGVEDGYEGKTMFAMFDTEKGGLEKRAFAFAAEKGGRGGVGGRDTDDMIEIRVYRAKGRRGVEPDVDCYQLPASIKAYGELKWSDYYGGNIDLVKAGLVAQDHPKLYYQYALLDPLDRPFATFRYYPRTWAQLEDLSIFPPTPTRTRTPTPIPSPVSSPIPSRSPTPSPSPNPSPSHTPSTTSSSSIRSFPSDYSPSPSTSDLHNYAPRPLTSLHSSILRFNHASTLHHYHSQHSNSNADSDSPLSIISEVTDVSEPVGAEAAAEVEVVSPRNSRLLSLETDLGMGDRSTESLGILPLRIPRSVPAPLPLQPMLQAEKVKRPSTPPLDSPSKVMAPQQLDLGIDSNIVLTSGQAPTSPRSLKLGQGQGQGWGRKENFAQLVRAGVSSKSLDADVEEEGNEKGFVKGRNMVRRASDPEVKTFRHGMGMDTGTGTGRAVGGFRRFFDGRKGTKGT